MQNTLNISTLLNNIDAQAFGLVIAHSLKSAFLNCKSVKKRDAWIAAITKAKFAIENDTDSIRWMPENDHIIFWSPDSNEIYTSNGVCQCKAYKNKQKPCYHRAIYRLVKMYYSLLGEEVADKDGKINFADAVYFDEQMTDAQKLRHLLIYQEENLGDQSLRIAYLSFLNPVAEKPKTSARLSNDAISTAPYLKKGSGKKPERFGKYTV